MIINLLERDAPGQQLDEISGSHDGVRVKRFLGGANCDASLDQIQRGFDVLRSYTRGGGDQKQENKSAIQPEDCAESKNKNDSDSGSLCSVF